MSLTSTVPSVVPSLLQSEKSRSRSWTKNNVPFTAVNPLKRKGGGGCKLSPTTSTVPAAVPSLFQSLSLPKVEKGEKPEAKKSVPLTLVRSWAPRALTITVPAAVPSVRHSPALVPSLAVKKTVPPASTNGPGDEPAAVLNESSMSLTRKACVFGQPCWPAATETVATSAKTSAKTRDHDFEEIGIAGSPCGRPSGRLPLGRDELVSRVRHKRTEFACGRAPSG